MRLTSEQARRHARALARTQTMSPTAQGVWQNQSRDQVTMTTAVDRVLLIRAKYSAGVSILVMVIMIGPYGSDRLTFKHCDG